MPPVYTDISPMIPPITGETIMDFNPDAKDLFCHYFLSPPFYELTHIEIDKLRNAHPLIRTKILSGFVWEGLSYLHLSSTLTENQALLPPKETQFLYDNPYIREARLEHLKRTTPDGLVFERREDKTFLSAACEYSAAKHLDRRDKKKQTRHYDKGLPLKAIFRYQPKSWQNALGEFIAQRFPGFPPTLDFSEDIFEIIYVLNTHVKIPSTVQGGRILRLPIHTKQLYSVCIALLEDFNMKYK